MIRRDLTAERLREVLYYDPDTGVFTWRRRSEHNRFDSSWNTRYAGTQAGCSNEEGYLKIKVDAQRYLGHRLAWLYVTGEWPAGLLDHRNGNTGDNRWCNIRAASASENCCNIRMRKNNRSGFKGVHYWPPGDCWRAEIWFARKRHYLGYFPSAEEAAAAYTAAARRLHGEFASPFLRQETQAA